MKTLVAVAALLLVVPAVSIGQGRQPSTQQPDGLFGDKASELMTKCRNITYLDPGAKGNPVDYSLCIGYITGVVDGGTVGSGYKAKTFPVCTPEGATREQLVRVVLKYGDDHPERLHLPAVAFVIEALANAFKCRVVPID